MRALIKIVAAAAMVSAFWVVPASAEVDIRTPWGNVYVGPEGVYVNGPWGRVEVPASERDNVCREWRKSVEEYYKDKRCDLEFDDKGCTIKKLECES